jgi:hypothetical protein
MARWRRFNRIFLGTLAVVVVLVAGFLAWTDPYRNIPFRDNTAQPLMDVNQRYLYPSVARDPRFDSAVFGTSSIRLLDPRKLEHLLGGRFAELAMNSATAYEEYRLAKLFIDWRKQRARPLRTVIFGIDVVWCHVEEGFQRFTKRPFPPWMYDDNRWNDLLYLFNSKALEIGARYVGYRLGLGDQPRYDRTGYADFLPPRSEYDLARARQHIYGAPHPKPIVPVRPPARISAAERREWTFATHRLFRELLERLPAETTKVIAFVPYHAYRQPRPGSRTEAVYEECKRRFVEMAQTASNAVVLDFMRPSAITCKDENYWDPLHYSVQTASLLVRLIGKAVATGKSEPAYYDALHDGVSGHTNPTTASSAAGRPSCEAY